MPRARESSGGQGWIRTSEGVSQWIYSPPRLATPEPTRRCEFDISRAVCAATNLAAESSYYPKNSAIEFTT